jgi:uncharacterized protein
MKRFLFALFLALGMHQAAFAQSEGRVDPPSASKSNGNSETLEKLKTFAPSHIQAVDDLLLTVKSRELYEEAIQAALRVQFETNPSLAQFRDVMEKFFREYCSWDIVKPEVTLSYLENFTEGEVRQLIAFYKTDIGKKALDVLPKTFSRQLEIGKNVVLRNRERLEMMVFQRIEELRREQKPNKP